MFENDTFKNSNMPVYRVSKYSGKWVLIIDPGPTETVYLGGSHFPTVDPVPELAGKEQLLLLCEGCQFGHKVAVKLSVHLWRDLLIRLASRQWGRGGQQAQPDKQQQQGPGPGPHPGWRISKIIMVVLVDFY